MIDFLDLVSFAVDCLCYVQSRVVSQLCTCASDDLLVNGTGIGTEGTGIGTEGTGIGTERTGIGTEETGIGTEETGIGTEGTGIGTETF